MFLRLLASVAFVVGLTLNAAAEDAKVASGIMASNFLVSATGLNNVEYSTALTSAFTTNGTSTVVVAHPGHGHSVGDKFSIADGPTINGLNMNGAWTVLSLVGGGNAYRFTHTGTASGSSGPTGSANVTFSNHADDGKLRFICWFSHMNYDDPIKNPGQQSATHLHTFFGNTLTNYTSTYATLRSTGNGTCDGGPINRTAYWFPSMITQSGTKAKYPSAFQWYYVVSRRDLVEYTSPACPGNFADGRAIACPTLPVKKLQRGQKAIFGFDLANAGLPAVYQGLVNGTNMLNGMWTCLDSGGGGVGAAGYRYLHHRTSSAQGLSSDGACPSSGIVQARLTSQSCWNGELDHADHYSHFAPPGNDNMGGTACPMTHPRKHISFEVIIHWTYTGGISTLSAWYLSSDRFNLANYEPGETFHWDMQFAWEDGTGQDVLAFWAANIHGMNPDPEGGFPYALGTTGGGGNAAQDWVGSKFMRNFNSGGLAVAPFTDCTVLGVAFASCQLKGHADLGIGITDVEIDIPAVPSDEPTTYLRYEKH